MMELVSSSRIKGVFIGYTEHLNQYLDWFMGRKDVTNATDPIFIEDLRDQQNSTPEQAKILDLTELGELNDREPTSG